MAFVLKTMTLEVAPLLKPNLPALVSTARETCHMVMAVP